MFREGDPVGSVLLIQVQQQAGLEPAAAQRAPYERAQTHHTSSSSQHIDLFSLADLTLSKI